MPGTDAHEELRQSLEEHKRELRLAVQDLGLAARRWTPLDGAIRERPGLWMLAGLAAGYWIGRR